MGVRERVSPIIEAGRDTRGDVTEMGHQPRAGLGTGSELAVLAILPVTQNLRAQSLGNTTSTITSPWSLPASSARW